MADDSTNTQRWIADAYDVRVRPPLHRPSPTRRFGRRWRERTDRRRAARAARKERGERSGWWDGFDLPFGEMDAFAAAVFVIVGAILLVLFLVFAGPFLWILLLLVLELVVWFALAIAGVVAWLLLGRPWQVVVVDQHGTTIAAVPVRGRRRAREHAAVVRTRLTAGALPAAALTTP